MSTVTAAAGGQNGDERSVKSLVVHKKPIQISEQDDRLYRHITLPNQMQVLLIHDGETDKEAAAMDVRVGQTSDPPHLQGAAHFCEHMLFLGTGKYPDENCYGAFLNSNGGSSNAFTSDEDTNYYFDVNAGHLDGALNIFSRFFIDPLFTESATDRELNAIDNENSKNLMSDSWRLAQVLKALSSPEHPWHQFGIGNAKTLRDDPKEAGVDVRAELLHFHGRYYSANLMRLVVLGRAGLDELQRMVVEKFSPVMNTDASPPSFGGKLPFGPEQVKQRIYVVPVREMREVTMSWPLPPINQHYRSKPDGYLSHLVGHEGSGSLLSLLKTKGWANGLSAGPYESASDWANFIVSVECTKSGIEHVDEIVSMTYQYLNMVRDEGVQEWIHLETQAIAAMNFRFSSKDNPMGFVSRLAGSMQLFPPELAVAGPWLLYDYASDLVRELLGYIVPSNMLLVVIGREFKGLTNEIEPWYGTEYSYEPLPEELINSWEACGRRDDLRLPEPNPMIATDFELRLPPPKDAPPGPSLIRDDAACRLWHKSDGTFRKPKLNVRAKLITPVLYNSPESLVLATLFVNLLSEDLNEELYMAKEAGLGLDLFLSKEALNLCLGGYNHKMKVLLERAVKHLTSFGDTLAHEAKEEAVEAEEEAESDVAQSNEATKTNGGSLGLFGRVRQKLHKRYKNYEFNTPYQHAVFATQSCVEVPKWSDEDKLNAIEGPGITLSAMLAFIPRLLSMLHVEMLVHGNATASEALELADVVVNGLASRPLPRYLWPEIRVVDLSAKQSDDFDQPCAAELSCLGEDAAESVESFQREHLVPEYRKSLTCPNPEETNSAVEVSFQVSLDDVRSGSLLALYTHLVKDKCFDQLRTKEQLGYLVWSSRSVYGGYVHNERFIVQSNDRSPRYLDQRVEAFIAGFRETLTSLTPEAFAANVQAVVDMILEKDKNLNQETSRHWSEISSRSYMFDRSVREAATVASLTPKDLLEFYDINFSKRGALRRKVSTWVYGNQHSMENDGKEGEGESGVDAMLPSGTGESGTGRKASRNDDTMISQDHDGGEETFCDTGEENGEDSKLRQVVIIEDCVEFKRSMPLLPLRQITRMGAVVETSKL